MSTPPNITLSIASNFDSDFDINFLSLPYCEGADAEILMSRPRGTEGSLNVENSSFLDPQTQSNLAGHREAGLRFVRRGEQGEEGATVGLENSVGGRKILLEGAEVAEEAELERRGAHTLAAGNRQEPVVEKTASPTFLSAAAESSVAVLTIHVVLASTFDLWCFF